MSPFMIFALVLTIAYAIYYAVVIAKDLQDKKGRTNSTEEVFDLDGMEEEESVEVSEAGDGFQVGNAGERPMIPSESEVNAPSEKTEFGKDICRHHARRHVPEQKCDNEHDGV